MTERLTDRISFILDAQWFRGSICKVEKKERNSRMSHTVSNERMVRMADGYVELE